MIYFKFLSTGKYTGVYTSEISDTILNPVTGDITNPSDIIKFEHSPEWLNVTTLTFDTISSPLNISNLTETEWSTDFKHEWLKSYLQYVGLNILIDSEHFSTILQMADDNSIFYSISYPSIAYVTQDSTSGEISIGMNVYDMNFVYTSALKLHNDNILKGLILNNYNKNEDGRPYKAYTSAVAKVSYMGISKNVWCFDGIEYNYTIDQDCTIETGGGNVIGEVKMAGNGVKTSYIIKKNIDEEDPTVGLASGEISENGFCMGDVICLIDTTVWTTISESDWTWIGDYTQLEYKWHIADLTNPTEDFKTEGIDNFLFPVRVLEDFVVGDFGNNIISITNHTTIKTDIIVHAEIPTDWDIHSIVVVTDLDTMDYTHNYMGDWRVVSRGTDKYASNGSFSSNYYRLRRSNFDNRLPHKQPTKGQIYLR
jgi:hypothetical protein